MTAVFSSTFDCVRGCDNLITVSLSKTPPGWYIGNELKELLPNDGIIAQLANREITTREYTDKLMEQFGKLRQIDIIHKLIAMGGDRDIILCCWGKSSEFCHRHLVSTWLNAWIYRNINVSPIRPVKELDIIDCHHVEFTKDEE